MVSLCVMPAIAVLGWVDLALGAALGSVTRSHPRHTHASDRHANRRQPRRFAPSHAAPSIQAACLRIVKRA